MTPSKSICHLFVYGTLREGVKHPYYSLIKEHSRFMGYGKVKARLYDIGGEYPAAIRDDAAGEMITGEIYRIKKNKIDFIFNHLDEYEDFFAEKPQDSEYLRELTTVYPDKGEAFQAWIYWYNKTVRGRKKIKSGDYIAWRNAGI